MRRNALDMYACLKCGAAFRLSSVVAEDSATGEIAEGTLECTQCHATVPIVRNLPRFFRCCWSPYADFLLVSMESF